MTQRAESSPRHQHSATAAASNPSTSSQDEQTGAVRTAKQARIVPILLSPSALGDLPLLLGFFVSIGIAVWLSVLYPSTILLVPIKVLLLGSFSLAFPLFGTIPLLVLCVLAARLFNVQFILGQDYVERISGRLGLTRRTTKVMYVNIREVLVTQTALQKFVNVGGLVLKCNSEPSSGADANSEADEQLHMASVFGPQGIKFLIEERAAFLRSENNQAKTS